MSLTIAQPAWEPRRDRWDRPVVPNAEGEFVPHIRASSLPNQLNDDFNINRWQKRGLVLGLGMRKDLWTSAGTLTRADGRQLDEIIKSAESMVDEDSQRHTGSAIHNYLQRGLDRADEMPEVHACAVEIRKALSAGGYELLPIHELFVINDELTVAGSLDGIVKCRDGKFRVWDIKTAGDVSKVPDFKAQAWSIQLYCYASAACTYGPDERQPMPVKIETDYGVVMFTDRSSGKTKLIRVDLVAGGEAARVAKWAYDWKKRKGIGVVEELELPLAGVLAESIEQSARPINGDCDACTGPLPCKCQREFDKVVEATKERARQYLDFAARIEIIKGIEGGAAALAAGWPRGVPTLKQSTEHDTEQLMAIERALVAIESKLRVKFPEGEAVEPKPWPKSSDAPKRSTPDDGRLMDAGSEQAAVDLLRSKLSAHMAAGSWMSQTLIEVKVAGWTLNLRSTPTERRFEACRFMLFLLDDKADEDFARAIVAHVLGSDEPLFPSLPFGNVLASLTIEEIRACIDLFHGQLTTTVDDAGLLRVIAA